VTQPLHDEDEPALDQRELVDGTGDNYGWPTFARQERDEMDALIALQDWDAAERNPS
jgi:hypothetical protein